MEYVCHFYDAFKLDKYFNEFYFKGFSVLTKRYRYHHMSALQMGQLLSFGGSFAGFLTAHGLQTPGLCARNAGGSRGRSPSPQVYPLRKGTFSWEIYGIPLDHPWIRIGYVMLSTLVICYIAIEHCPFIVDLSMIYL